MKKITGLPDGHEVQVNRSNDFRNLSKDNITSLVKLNEAVTLSFLPLKTGAATTGQRMCSG